MKKFILAVLIITMLFTTISVSASPNTLMKITQVGSVLGTPVGSAYANGGLGGKSSNEYAYKLETTGANARQVVQVKAGDYTFSNSAYVVMDLNILPTTSDTVIACGPDAGGLYTVQANVGDLKIGVWNKVRIVVQNKSEADIRETQKYQEMTMYINDVRINTGISAVLPNDVLSTTPGGTYSCGIGFRLNLFDTTDATTAYVADIMLSDSDVDEAPVQATIGTSEKYTVGNGRVTLKEPATLEDIKSSSSSVIKLFTDSSFKTEIVDESVLLKEGNILLATDANKSYSYYSIFEHDYIYYCDMSNGIVKNEFLTTGAWSCSTTEDGFAGKPDSYITATGSANSYMQLYYDSDSSTEGKQLMNKDSAKYVVLSFDVAPDELSNSNFSIRTVQNNTVIAKNYFASLDTDKWNNVTLVIKNNADDGNADVLETVYESASAAREVAIHTVDLYINGVLVDSDLSTGVFGMQYTQGGSTRYGDMIRILAENENEKVCRFDNIKLYEMTAYDSTSFMDSYPGIVSVGAKATIDENTIILNEGVALTTDDLVLKDGCKCSLFDSTMTEKTDAFIKKGDIIVVTDGFTIKNYVVINSVGAIVLRNSNNATVEYINKSSEDVTVIAVAAAWDGEKYVAKTVVTSTVNAGSNMKNVTLDFESHIDASCVVNISIWKYDFDSDTYDLLSDEIY